MARIFISYSRGEREAASRLAERLTEEGYDVWWDAAILGGTRFEDEIADVLKRADVALILWSRGAAKSDWVRAEAEIARVNKTALPVVIDDVDLKELPILFQQIHAIDLRDWDGNPAAEGYQQILKSIAGRIKSPPGPKRSPTQAQSRIKEDTVEAAAWAELERTKDASAADYRSFIKRFGADGEYAVVAQMRVDRLQRRAGSRRWLLSAVLVVAIAAVGVSTALLRPDLVDWIVHLVQPKQAAACKPEDVVTSPTGTFSICLNSRVWVVADVDQTKSINRQTKDGTMILFLRTAVVTADPEEHLSQILIEADHQTSTVGTSAVVSRSTAEINGRHWSVFEYTRPRQTDVENNLIYYYTKPGYGYVEINLYGTTTSFDQLTPYAEEIVKTATFE